MLRPQGTQHHQPQAEKGRPYCSLSSADIEKFQTLYKEQFGKEISREDAYESGAKLLRLMAIIYKPMTEREFELIQEHRTENSPWIK